MAAAGGFIFSNLRNRCGGLSKEGLGTIVLCGSNTYVGSTAVTAGTLTLGNTNALCGSPLDTTSSVVGTAAAGLKTTITSLTFGGLSGNKDLATVFTTTSGGFDAVTGITLNPGNAVTATYTGGYIDDVVVGTP